MTPLRIALRYIFSRKSHNAVNVIAAISIAGVAVATIAIVCVQSVFNGFADLAMSRLPILDPAVKVVPAQGKAIDNADSLAASLMLLPEVELALPTIQEHALAMNADGSRQMAVTLRGVPQRYNEVTNITSTFIAPDYLTHSAVNFMPDCAASVGVAIGLQVYPEWMHSVKVYVPRRSGKINPANPMAAYRADSLVVGGVFQSLDSDVDDATLYIPLSMARSLLDYADNAAASAIELSPAAGVTDAQLRDAVSRHLGTEFRVMNRLEQRWQSLQMIAVEKWITFAMLAFILLIASFNIVSTMSMLILEKRSDMATLRSLGASPRQIRAIFFHQGWLIAAIGGIVGIVVGMALCLAQQWGGFIKLAADTSQLTIAAYPVRLAMADIAATAALIAIVGLIVGFIASRMAPASPSNNR